jgi:single-strand DNA-binding protein
MSKSINKVILIGNVGKQPEVKYTPSGTAVAKLTIATNERFKEGTEWKDRTEWHNVVLFQKLAEVCSEYVKKGSKLYVEGRLQTRSWEKDGIKKYSTEIVGNELVLLSGNGQPAAQPETVGVGAGDDSSPF